MCEENGAALALGAPPVASLAAALPLPAGVSEGEYVGMLAGRPLDMVRCELQQLGKSDRSSSGLQCGR